MLNKDVLKKIFDIEDAVNVSELANKTGLDKDTISDIVYRKTKNPGVYTIAKIADAFKCSVDDLVAESKSDKQTEFKLYLAKSCIIITAKLLSQVKQVIEFTDFLLLIRKIYIGAIAKKITKVDAPFVKTYINNFLKEDQNAER